MKFSDLKLSNEMLEALAKMGFDTPSEIQAAAIPVALEGKDIIGQAQTGTGKTASFAIPLIENTIPGMGIQHVILAPSRELANQIYDETYKLSSTKKLRIANIIGGISYDIQRKDIQRNPEILIATPGRLIDHLESKRIDINFVNVKTLVLDEADEMLNFGFYKEMKKIAEYLPKERQTLFFTATFNAKTKKLANELLKNPVEISVSSGLSTNERIEQEYVVLKEKKKLVALFNLLQLHDHESVMIFGRTKRRVEELSTALISLGFKALGIQGDMRQKERSRAMQDFRDGKIKILIGTDVLARGIDVDTVDLVFNFDLPTEIEYYTHRIGRTGRAGRKGKAISFVKETELFYFEQILDKTQSTAKLINEPTDEDMADKKAAELDGALSKLLHTGREKYSNVATKIMNEYNPEDIALMLAAASIGEGKNPYEISLSGEAGAETKRSGRGGGRGGSSSRGGDRGGRGGDRGGRSSSRGGDRGGRGGDRKMSDRDHKRHDRSQRRYAERGAK